MASGPYADARRGTWSVQWFDGVRWKRTVVIRRPGGWKVGDPMPRKPPIEAIIALTEYAAKEDRARRGHRPEAVRPVGDFLASYREGYGPTHRPGSTKLLGLAIAGFATWCVAAKVKTAATLTGEHCRAWVAFRSATAAPATVAKERGLLAAAWNQAVREGAIERNPWRNAPAPEIPRKRRGSWSPEEFAALLAVSPLWLRDALTIGVNAGPRVSALVGLEWRDLTWGGAGGGLGVVTIRPELDKAGKGYTVPMSAAAHDVFARRLAMRGYKHERVIAGAAGRPLDRKRIFSAIRAACRKANLPPASTHHMRRTFGRWAVMGHLTGRPVPLYVVQRWLGHASPEMTQRYLDIREEEHGDWMADRRPTGGSE